MPYFPSYTNSQWSLRSAAGNCGTVTGVTVLSQEIDARQLAGLQALWTTEWHQTGFVSPAPPAGSLVDLAYHEHRANFALWHEEDKARDPSASDHDIATVKRAIDSLNQQRNDRVEQMDTWLLERLPQPASSTPLHSETPGMMLDRLSILALKIFHTREETQRPDTARKTLIASSSSQSSTPISSTHSKLSCTPQPQECEPSSSIGR